MGERKNIKKSIKYKIFLNDIKKCERYIVNFLALGICVLIMNMYNNFLGYNVLFYEKEDIQSFNIEKISLVKIYNDAVYKNIEFEKLVAMYSKENNYFSENSYIVDYDSSKKNKILSNINFGIFSLNYENREVYNMLKVVNEEIENLPINSKYYKDVLILNSFDTSKEVYGTGIIDNSGSNENITVISATSGIVEEVGYKGDEGLSVIISSKSGTKYKYTNLKETYLEVGDNVEAKNIVGLMGSSKEINYGVVFERKKLNFYVIYESDIFVDNKYINSYPFLYINSISSD